MVDEIRIKYSSKNRSIVSVSTLQELLIEIKNLKPRAVTLSIQLMEEWVFILIKRKLRQSQSRISKDSLEISN